MLLDQDTARACMECLSVSDQIALSAGTCAEALLIARRRSGRRERIDPD